MLPVGSANSLGRTDSSSVVVDMIDVRWRIGYVIEEVRRRGLHDYIVIKTSLAFTVRWGGHKGRPRAKVSVCERTREHVERDRGLSSRIVKARTG